MSTWLYLRCEDHDPPLYSEDVGQHLYDLPDIRGYIADRERFVAAQAVGLTPQEHFIGNAARFLVKHPKCRIGIEDEYLVTHPAIEGACD